MALANGVLVHGPNSWACAVRHPDGRLEVASDHKRYRASGVTNPLPARPGPPAEAIALLPQVRRRMPWRAAPLRAAPRPDRDDRRRDRDPDHPRLARALACGEGSRRRDRVARAGRRCAPQLRARRLPRRRAHRDRHLRARRGAPRRSTSAAARISWARSSGRSRSGTSSRRALRGSSGSRRAGWRRSARSPFRPRSSRGWSRNPDHPVSRALAKPGHEIQHRLATAEPTPEQLEVAEAALAACLELENGDED